MKKITLIVMVTILAIFAMAIGASAMTVSEMTASYSKEINHTNAMELQMYLDAGENFIIIDVRSPEEYAAGHLPGAINMDFGLLMFKIGTIITNPETEFILYCRSGGRSVIATKLVKDLGYKNAVNLQGGFMDWAKAGYPVETKHGLFILEKWEEK